jgi:peptidoglycan hydrolase-like protein with peptidoglycan-binding domain
VSTPSADLRRKRSLPLRALGAVSASAVALPLVASPASAGVIAFPVPSRALPSALDVAAPYQEGTRCLTSNQPGAVAFAKLLNATYGTRTYGILRRCAAEHGEGRALDWMISAGNASQLALANALTRWLVAPDSRGRPGAMARRFGINYIIWNRHQWRAWAPERGWVQYYGVSPHTDHIHFSFNWDGAYKRTSWWSGVAVTRPLTGPTSSARPVVAPAPAPAVTASGYPLLREGARGSLVTRAQKVLGVGADGTFGPRTTAALRTWQAKHGVPVTGRLDNATWATMLYLRLVPTRPSALSPYTAVVLSRGSTGAAVKALQRAVGRLVVDGSFGPATAARVTAYQKAKGLPATGRTDRRLWFTLMGAVTTAPAAAPAPTPSTSPLARYAGTTLRLWSKGPAVSALQKAIGRLTVDGSYGPLTQARVKEYQRSKGLPVTGVTDARVWKALMAPAAAPRTPATPAAARTEFTAVKGTVLRLGASGAAVKVLQRGLGALAVDGSFGPRTLAAVKAFQAAHRLPATGVVDAKTWSALERRVHPLLPYWGTVLRSGSTGAAVVALQKALRISADGSYGPATVAAVKALQKRAALTQTGVVGLVTWKAVEARMPR